MTTICALIFGPEYSLRSVLQPYWYILPIAFVVTLAATALCRHLALRFGVVDYPDRHVKTHARPTAYLGGLGMLAGLLVGLAIGFWILLHRQSHVAGDPQTDPVSNLAHIQNWLLLAGITLGALIACVVGVVDDLYDIKPWQKFLGQALAGAVIFAVGIRVNLVHLLRYPIFDVQLSPTWAFILGAPIVLFFILGASNSLNLLDGLDGLCAGVTAIITLAFLALALSLATWNYSPVGDPIRIIVSLALVGAALGFLPLNRHPAKIFMGDAGSMLLGFICGTLMILFTEKLGRWSVAALIIFGLPILDTAIALVRRMLNRRPLFVSDRSHIYDQLMDKGWTLRRTVAACYVLAGFYALIGLVASTLRFRHAVVVFILLMAASALVAYRRGFFRMPPAAPRQTPDTPPAK